MNPEPGAATRDIATNAGRSLGRATGWALAIALVLLVTVVLPAEYGIDWTGAGRLLGLTAMGEGKVAAARAASANAPASSSAAPPGSAAASVATASTRTFRHDSIEVTLAPKGEVEYKALLEEGESMVFEWDSGSSQVGFDFHGEPKPGPDGAFLSFDKGVASRSAGSLRAPFTGTHGWYWNNSTSSTVVIKLRTSGFYSEIKRN